MLHRVENLLEKLIQNGEITVAILNEAYTLLEMVKKDRHNAIRQKKTA